MNTAEKTSSSNVVSIDAALARRQRLNEKAVRGKFDRVPRNYYKKISDSKKTLCANTRVLFALLDNAHAALKGWNFDNSSKNISKLTGVPAKHVPRCIRILKEANMIEYDADLDCYFRTDDLSVIADAVHDETDPNMGVDSEELGDKNHPNMGETDPNMGGFRQNPENDSLYIKKEEEKNKNNNSSVDPSGSTVNQTGGDSSEKKKRSGRKTTRKPRSTKKTFVSAERWPIPEEPKLAEYARIIGDYQVFLQTQKENFQLSREAIRSTCLPEVWHCLPVNEQSRHVMLLHNIILGKNCVCFEGDTPNANANRIIEMMQRYPSFTMADFALCMFNRFLDEHEQFKKGGPKDDFDWDQHKDPVNLYREARKNGGFNGGGCKGMTDYRDRCVNQICRKWGLDFNHDTKMLEVREYIDDAGNYRVTDSYNTVSWIAAKWRELTKDFD